MYYVYLIRSLNYPTQTYIGFSKNLKERIHCHNSGGSPHTSKFKPWELQAYFAFRDEKTAIQFEKYLKTQSGRNFANKRFW